MMKTGGEIGCGDNGRAVASQGQQSGRYRNSKALRQLLRDAGDSSALTHNFMREVSVGQSGDDRILQDPDKAKNKKIKGDNDVRGGRMKAGKTGDHCRHQNGADNQKGGESPSILAAAAPPA